MIKQIGAAFMLIVIALFVIWSFRLLMAGLAPLIPLILIGVVLLIAIRIGWRILFGWFN